MKSALLVLLLSALSAGCQAFLVGHGAVRQCQPLRAHRADAEADASSDDVTGRRALLNSMMAAGATLGLSSFHPRAAIAAGSGAESFVGTYSDPINHPGGTREIKLIDGATVGEYQLAQVFGGGGRGEPKEYVLPAVIVGNRSIVIDFSPKGGPRDFAGVLEGDGSIKFVRDGNRWPRL